MVIHWPQTVWPRPERGKILCQVVGGGSREEAPGQEACLQSRAPGLGAGRQPPCSLHPAGSGKAWVGFCVGLELPFSAHSWPPPPLEAGETSVLFTWHFQGTAKVP